MLSRNLKVALIEENVIWGDKDANLSRLQQNMRNLPDGTDLVILPELFSTGFITSDREQAALLAERNTGATIRALHELAKQYHVAFAGSFMASTAGQIYNRAFFIEPNGEDTFYDKKHLFAFGGEDKVYKAGFTQAPVIRFRGFNVKLIVCYDLRFPVFCRNVNNAYDVLIVVANWPHSRQQAWKQLLIARALENECYVCGVNRSGTDSSGVEYGEGSSFVIDFKGKIIGQRTDGAVIEAELRPDALLQFREKFPAWRDADSFTLL